MTPAIAPATKTGLEVAATLSTSLGIWPLSAILRNPPRVCPVPDRARGSGHHLASGAGHPPGGNDPQDAERLRYVDRRPVPNLEWLMSVMRRQTFAHVMG